MKKNKILKLIFGISLLIGVIGVSYAFFIYNKTGVYTHTITGGKMKVIYDETTGNNITIENAYPLTDEEALTKSLEFEFTITGYNESDKNIYYAIEMDYGSDIEDKIRFRDSDIKLTLYENDKLVIENEIFNNLNNQDIYYGIIEYGTDESRPTIHNYKMNIWINDNVIISDTLSNDIVNWNDKELEWFFSRYNSEIEGYQDLVNTCGESPLTCDVSNFGINVYTSDEFANRYASFKVNVKADLTYDDVDYITYNANGGEFEPEKSSLLTNMITTKKPVMEGKSFLGWSSDKNATVPEYKAGDQYSGEGQVLFAVYGPTRNVMGDLTPLAEYQEKVSQIIFINDYQENIDIKYEEAEVKADLTYEDYGSVKAWLEVEPRDSKYYVMYIASEGTTYLSTGKNLFYDWSYVSNFDLGNVDTSMVTDMSGMFSGLNHNARFATMEVQSIGFIKKLDLSMFNTANVTDMSRMFSGIMGVQMIDVTNFNTSNVTNMSSMFSDCINLRSIDVSEFDTSKVTDMSRMFSGGSEVYNRMSIEHLDVSNFDTKNVTSMKNMFLACDDIKNLNVSGFDTSKVTDMSGMFELCVGLLMLDVSSFDTSKVTDMSDMFAVCGQFTELNLSNFDTSNVTDMSSMFGTVTDVSLPYTFHNNKLERIILSKKFITSKVTDMSSMFKGCIVLTSLDVSGFDTSKVTSMTHMFSDCWDLTILDLSSFDITNLKYATSMFFKCKNLTTIFVSSEYSDWKTSNLLYSSGMFSDCYKLVGSISFSANKNDINYANSENGYFTIKN